MTDTPSAEALAKELLSWLACDHEPWRIPEMVKRLDDAFAQAVAASREPPEGCIKKRLLDTASERAKPGAGDEFEDERQRALAIGGRSLGDRLYRIPTNSEAYAETIILAARLLDARDRDLAEARRAEREKCAQYVREAADGAATFSDDALYRIADGIRALTPEAEGRS